jgi:hypothetical protein
MTVGAVHPAPPSTDVLPARQPGVLVLCGDGEVQEAPTVGYLLTVLLPAAQSTWGRVLAAIAAHNVPHEAYWTVETIKTPDGPKMKVEFCW